MLRSVLASRFSRFRSEERGDSHMGFFFMAFLVAVGWWIANNIHGCISSEVERRENRGMVTLEEAEAMQSEYQYNPTRY